MKRTVKNQPVLAAAWMASQTGGLRPASRMLTVGETWMMPSASSDASQPATRWGRAARAAGVRRTKQAITPTKSTMPCSAR